MLTLPVVVTSEELLLLCVEQPHHIALTSHTHTHTFNIFNMHVNIILLQLIALLFIYLKYMKVCCENG